MAGEAKAFENGVDKLWRQVDNLSAQSQRDIIMKVAEIRREIVDKLSGAPVVTGLGGVETLDPQFLAGYRDQLHNLLVQWARDLVDNSGSTVERAANLGVGGYDKLLAELSGAPFTTLSPSIMGLAPELVQAASLFTAEQFRGLANEVQTTVANQVQRAVFGGQSRWDAVRNIRDALKGQPGQTQNLGSLTSKATSIERTAIMSVFNAAAQVSYIRAEASLPGLKVEWSTAGQKTVCPKCAGVNGERKKPREKFSIGVLAPPAHPRCRCRVIAWRADWE